MFDLPTELRYSEDHEWAIADSADPAVIRIGITEYAASQLGDIVYVDLPEVGQDTTAGEACGELESTKSVSDLICPVSGVVTAVNDAVVNDSALVNTDPYGGGWLIEVRTTDADPLAGLLDAAAYDAHTA